MKINELNLYAVLFAQSRPIKKQKLYILFETGKDNLDTVVEALKKHLKHTSPFEIRETDNTLFLVTRSEFGDLIRQTKREQRQKISSQALEILAIIAYKQPISKADIDGIRNCDSEFAISTLLQEKLIKRLISATGAALYQTTEEFLIRFNIKSLVDLPSLKKAEILK